MPGPVSRTLNIGAPAIDRDADIDPPAFRRVTQRVVDEVRQERRQRIGVAAHPHRAVRIQSEVDALGGRERRELGHDLARQRRQVDRRRRAVGNAGLLARQGQQLLDQPRGALEPALQIGQARRGARRRSVARSASCACRWTAVSGVRNSCAASAMNERCAASA